MSVTASGLYVPLSEVSKVKGVSDRTLRRWMAAGKMPKAKKLKGRRNRVLPFTVLDAPTEAPLEAALVAQLFGLKSPHNLNRLNLASRNRDDVIKALDAQACATAAEIKWRLGIGDGRLFVLEK